MVDLLPCPFCGSLKVFTEDNGKYVHCADQECAGGQAWFYTEKWQKRKTLSDDQLKTAYAQFEASLKEAQAESNRCKDLVSAAIAWNNKFFTPTQPIARNGSETDRLVMQIREYLKGMP